MSFQVIQSSCDMPLSQHGIETAKISYRSLCTRAVAGFALAMSISFIGADKSYAAEHVIEMYAEDIQDDGLLLAYRMHSHKVDGLDVTGRHSPNATRNLPTHQPQQTVSMSPDGTVPMPPSRDRLSS
jgi:hypothetical protein